MKVLVKTPFRRLYMSIELLVLRMEVGEWMLVLAIFKIELSKAVWTILNIPSQYCYLRRQLNYTLDCSDILRL